MDSRSQNDRDGGGGVHGGSVTGLSSVLHDDGRSQQLPLQTTYGSDVGVNSGQRSQTPPLLSLDQIKITGSSNEYTDGPTGAHSAQQQKTDLVRTSGQQGTLEERHQNLHNLQSLAQHGSITSSTEDVLQSSSVGGSQSSIRTSKDSTNSSLRPLSSPVNGDQIIRIQPKRSELNSEELKPLNEEFGVVAVTPGSTITANNNKHSDKCEECERCKCLECSRPRTLPSCWMCGRRCVCSAHSAVEHWTCACCIKGLFYHCSSDDEDTCVDKPFSCSQSHCCIRWTTISLLTLVLPCLLCYLPAKGCVTLCQRCYDRATRPGCRCKNSSAFHYHEDGKTT
ncbi:protein sprouty homolog 2 [Nematolebias whitei]|uniref:protein sprouty homolog 2 n=1 Tax=Nematolebias whitei TaxID=451745 RepID=UPI00189AE2F6|nr:protein sprouty homolog 2 [Nematolebias whitei]